MCLHCTEDMSGATSHLWLAQTPAALQRTKRKNTGADGSWIQRN